MNVAVLWREWDKKAPFSGEKFAGLLNAKTQRRKGTKFF
jgi:hypothetical protein